MFFLRLLVYVFLFWLVAKILKWILAPSGSPHPQRPAGPPPPPPPPWAGPQSGGSVERLVQDPVCGLRIPESAAIRAGDNFFCSPACRDAFVAKN